MICSFIVCQMIYDTVINKNNDDDGRTFLLLSIPYDGCISDLFAFTALISRLGKKI